MDDQVNYWDQNEDPPKVEIPPVVTKPFSFLIEKSLETRLGPALERNKNTSIGMVTYNRTRTCFPLKLHHEEENKLPETFKNDPDLIEFKMPDEKYQKLWKAMNGAKH